jgi:ubiquitin-conjugating enzyme E2 Q
MEFQHLARACEAGEAPCANLALPNESDVHVWTFTLSDFDSDTRGGALLNADLARLQAEHGVGHLMLEATFPRDYPTRPFLLRLIYPRCQWYTGHVTAGGSICMEALAQTGSPNSWRPDYCLSGLLPLVKQNLVDVESVMIRTATGPGGRAGPLRIDFARQWHPHCRTPLDPYSRAEAVAAFARSEAHHRANGW